MAKRKGKERGTAPSNADALAVYLAEIHRIPLLTADEERRLARLFRTGADSSGSKQGKALEAAHTLVVSNLRFVVKVANGYRSYGLRMADLIQEGNIGLMKAVQKFDPDRGVRLISYAVWWIRAYIQKHILRHWSLVKMGTTQAQRALFFSLKRTQRELERLGAEPSDAAVAAKLKVKPSDVEEMRRRLDGRDLSLDVSIDGESGAAHADVLKDDATPADEALLWRMQGAEVQARIRHALKRLDDRERFIVEHRLMAEKPMTLKAIGEHFGVSRERIRQLEMQAKQKLKLLLADLGNVIVRD